MIEMRGNPAGQGLIRQWRTGVLRGNLVLDGSFCPVGRSSADYNMSIFGIFIACNWFVVENFADQK
jgi:hypothetical protein